MPDTPDDSLIAFTVGPVRLTAPDVQPLRLALDVERYAALDLELQIYEGSNVEVRLLTGMHKESEEGWLEVDRFVPTSAHGAAMKPFFPLLRYARWELLNASGGTFLLHGVGRRRLGFVPTEIEGCILWLRADRGLTLSGSNVSSWRDFSGRGHEATQATSADQPGYLPQGWSSGLPTVDFDRANTEWMDLGAMSDSSSDYTLLAALAQRSQTSYPQDLLSARIPAGTSRAFATVTHLSSGVGIYDGSAWRATGAEQDGEQWLTWVLDAAAGSFECYRSGASIGTGTYAGSWIWDNPELGRLSGSTQYLDAELAELILYRRKLAPSELARVHAYLSARYG